MTRFMYLFRSTRGPIGPYPPNRCRASYLPGSTLAFSADALRGVKSLQGVRNHDW